MPTPVLDPATSLNRDCHCIGTDVPLVRSWIQRELEAHGIHEPLVSTHPHLFSSASVFVDSAHVSQAHALIAAIDSVVELPSYREAVLAHAPSLAHIDNGTHGVFLGYDFHVTAAGLQLIEINTNAGGAMLNTLLSRAQQACCPEMLSMTPTVESIALVEQRFVEMFRREWLLSRGEIPLRRIAIVDDTPQAQYLYPEFVLFQKLFEAHGIATVITDSAALQFDGVHVTQGGHPIDLIYNRLTDFYFEAPEHSLLREAHRIGSVVATPQPRAHALYANKRNLTLLSDENELRRLGVSAQVIHILLGHIPRTRTVSAAAREQWWAERKQWFFKPTGSYAGRGAYRGDKITRKMFDDVMQGDYVAQAIVPPSTRSHERDAKPLRWDLRVYAYGAAPLLQAVRLYEGQTTNFRTPGGGFGPVFVTPLEQIGNADAWPSGGCASQGGQ